MIFIAWERDIHKKKFKNIFVLTVERILIVFFKKTRYDFLSFLYLYFSYEISI